MKTEAAMVRILKDFFESQDFVTIQELGVGYGVADLVVYRLAQSNCQQRIKNRQKNPLERIEFFQLLEAIPDIETGGSIPLKDLKNVTHFSESRLKYHWLKVLENYGYVKEISKNRYSKVNGFIPVAEEIVAIEAKLRDWKRGAIQAKRYAVFADRTYLAIDKKVTHRVDKELLSKHNIGLLIVSEEGISEAFKAPCTGPKNRFKHRLAGEAAWKTYYRKYKKMMEHENAPEYSLSKPYLHS